MKEYVCRRLILNNLDIYIILLSCAVFYNENESRHSYILISNLWRSFHSNVTYLLLLASLGLVLSLVLVSLWLDPYSSIANVSAVENPGIQKFHFSGSWCTVNPYKVGEF